MWTSNSALVPLELIEAELQGKVPLGTTAAAHAFTTQPDRERLSQLIDHFGIDRTTAKIAWKYLETGKIVTSASVTQTATPVVESPTESATTETPSDSNLSAQIQAAFEDQYPTAMKLNEDALKEAVAWAGGMAEFRTLLLAMKNIERDQKILKPAGFMLYLMRNEKPEKIAERAHAELNRKQTTQDILDDLLANSADKLAEVPAPGPTEEEVERRKQLNKMAEEVFGGAERTSG